MWDAISSGVRFELITFLASGGPCSIAELAKMMDVAADGLYHHIRRLEKVGLVHEAGFEKVGKQYQAIYDVVAEQIRFDVQSQKAITRNLDRLKKLNSTVFRRAERVFAKALESGVLCFNENNRNALMRSDTAWLNEKEKKRAFELMKELLEIFENGRKKPEGELHALTIQFSPLVRNRKAKEK